MTCIRRTFKVGMAVMAAAGLLAGAASGTFAASHGTAVRQRTSAAASQWTVLVGGDSHNQAFQAMGFFPHVITVDAGDTVHFRFEWAHTVSFPGKGGNLGVGDHAIWR
jgi:plastocyanin